MRRGTLRAQREPSASGATCRTPSPLSQPGLRHVVRAVEVAQQRMDTRPKHLLRVFVALRITSFFAMSTGALDAIPPQLNDHRLNGRQFNPLLAGNQLMLRFAQVRATMGTGRSPTLHDLVRSASRVRSSGIDGLVIG